MIFYAKIIFIKLEATGTQEILYFPKTDPARIQGKLAGDPIVADL